MGQKNSKRQEQLELYGTLGEAKERTIFRNNGLTTNQQDYRSTNNALYRSCNVYTASISYDKFIEMRYDPINDPECVTIGRRTNLYLLPMGNGVIERRMIEKNQQDNGGKTPTQERTRTERKTIDCEVSLSTYSSHGQTDGKLDGVSRNIRSGHEFVRRLGICLHTKGHRLTGNSSVVIYDYLRYDERNKRYCRKRKHRLFLGLKQSEEYQELLTVKYNNTDHSNLQRNTEPIIEPSGASTTNSFSRHALTPSSTGPYTTNDRQSMLSNFTFPTNGRHRDRNVLHLGPSEASKGLRPGDQVYAINGTIVFTYSQKNILRMITNVLEETSLPLIIVWKKYEGVNSTPFSQEIPLEPPLGVPYCPHNEYSMTLYGSMPGPEYRLASPINDSNKNGEENLIRKDGRTHLNGTLGAHKLSSVSI